MTSPFFHLGLDIEHGSIFYQDSKWFYQPLSSFVKKGSKKTQKIQIQSQEPIELAPGLTLVTTSYVESKKFLKKRSSWLSSHLFTGRALEQKKYRLVLGINLVTVLILLSVIGYRWAHQVSLPVNRNNLIQKVRSKIVEFIVEPNEENLKELQSYANLKSTDFKKYSGFCTGFLISKNVILTASHCLLGSMIVDINGQFELKTFDGKKHKVQRVLGFDIKRDYLYLETKGMEEYGYLEFAKDHSVEQKIFTVGNVHGQGIAIRDGIISNETKDPNDPEITFIRYSAGTSPGNSGGPLLNSQGQVVALVFASNWTENFNIGTPVADLKKGFDRFVHSKKKRNIQISMKDLVRFDPLFLLQSLSIPYPPQFGDYPEIQDIFKEISVKFSLPMTLSDFEKKTLKRVNRESLKAYFLAQKQLKKKKKFLLSWKSFVSKKTPSILPSQFDLSQSVFIKRGNRYYPKVAGFIDTPLKSDMTKYVSQLKKQGKFDFQAYGYNIYPDPHVEVKYKNFIFYKPQNTTGLKLRLQRLAQGVPYAQMILSKTPLKSSPTELMDIHLFLKRFSYPEGVIAHTSSQFLRPKFQKDFDIKNFKFKKIQEMKIRDIQGRIWTREQTELFGTTRIFNYCTDLPEGSLCVARIFNVYSDTLLHLIESNFRKFYLSRLLINPFFWNTESLLKYIRSPQVNGMLMMQGIHLKKEKSVIQGHLKDFNFHFQLPQSDKVKSIRLQTGLLGGFQKTSWVGYGLEWIRKGDRVSLPPNRKKSKLKPSWDGDWVCGLGVEVLGSRSNFILNFLRDRKKQEKLKKIKGEPSQPLPQVWHQVIKKFKKPLQVYGYCAPLREDPMSENQYFVDFKKSKPLEYIWSFGKTP